MRGEFLYSSSKASILQPYELNEIPMPEVQLCVDPANSLITQQPISLGYSVLNNGGGYLILVPHVAIPEQIIFDGDGKRLALRLGGSWASLDDVPADLMRALALDPSTVQLGGADVFARPTFCVSLARLSEAIQSPGEFVSTPIAMGVS